MVSTATQDHIHVLIVECSSLQLIKWSDMFVFTLVHSRSHVDSVYKALKDLTGLRDICWSHTMKALDSCVTFVRTSSAANVTLSNTCSDMKVWNRMFAMNVQSVSVQHLNWTVISLFTLTTDSSTVFLCNAMFKREEKHLKNAYVCLAVHVLSNAIYNCHTFLTCTTFQKWALLLRL